MKTRFTAAFMVITLLFTMVNAFNVYAYEDCLSISIDVQDGRLVNAYYEDEVPTFSLTIENTGGNSIQATLSCKVINDAGTTVGSYTHTHFLAANQKKLIGFAPDLKNKFGIYTLSAVLTAGSESAEDNFRFSYTKRTDAFLDGLGFACHFSKASLAGGNYETVKMGQKVIAESGAGWIRDGISWSDVEKVKGTYTVPADIDNYVNMAVANGQKVILLVSGGNALYETGNGPNGEAVPCLPVTDAGIKGFADFAAFVAQHFKGRVDTFEIWNEPDTPGFSGHYDWLPSQSSWGWYTLASKSADAYADLIKAVYPAIKNVYKGEEDKVTVVSGGALPIMSSDGYMYMLLNKSGVQDCIDAVGIHPYGHDAMPADVCSGDDRDFTRQIKFLKSWTSKPIYITEYGASSFGDSTNKGDDGVSAFTGYGIWGIDGQAMALVRAYMVTAFDPQVKVLSIHRFKAHSTIGDVETDFGVLDYDYMPKRAYGALANMSSILADAQPVKEVAAIKDNYNSNNCILHYEFEDSENGDRIFAVAARNSSAVSGTTLKVEENNASSESVAAVLDNTNKCLTVKGFSGGSIKVVDMLGNELYSADGVYQVGMAPVYVICSKPFMNISGNTVNISGKAEMANSLVTIVAYKKNSLNQEIAYINQAKSDASGNYTFTFEKSAGDIYDIRVYNGSSYLNESCDTELYDIDLKLYQNGVEVKKIGELQLGDVIKLEMKITDTNLKNNNLVACGCIYGENAVMLDIDRSVSVWSGNSTVLTTELMVTENTDIKALKFMLWDMNMRPVFNSIQAD